MAYGTKMFMDRFAQFRSLEVADQHEKRWEMIHVILKWKISEKPSKW
jgi:hypothetical protein